MGGVIETAPIDEATVSAIIAAMQEYAALARPRAAVGEREATIAAWVAENPFPKAPYGCEHMAKYLMPQAAWYAAKADFLRSLALQSPPAKVEG